MLTSSLRREHLNQADYAMLLDALNRRKASKRSP
jgi:hypothetical protein